MLPPVRYLVTGDKKVTNTDSDLNLCRRTPMSSHCFWNHGVLTDVFSIRTAQGHSFPVAKGRGTDRQLRCPSRWSCMACSWAAVCSQVTRLVYKMVHALKMMIDR